LIFRHVVRAGIPDDAPELHHLSRSLFLVSRQCGASGLSTDSRELFELALASRRGQNVPSWDFRLYRAATSVLGWCTTGRLACWMDQWRPVTNALGDTEALRGQLAGQ
jgi:hypothetical protein